MKQSHVEKMSTDGVIIKAGPKGCSKPLFAMIDSKHLSDNFTEYEAEDFN
jgi:hypothetical protein